MVQQAQGSKSPVQKLVDKVAGIFVPVVIAVSILTFITWMIIGGDNAFTHALLTSITVLVIACPCALGLATPTAIMVGIGRGADNNILIKDAESLELAVRVNAVVIDKTGTITEGKPVVTDMVWFDSGELENNKRVLHALESRSEHPLATAVVSKLKEENIETISLDHFESLTARGISGRVNGIQYFAGNERLMRENGITLQDDVVTTVRAFEVQNKSVIYFASDIILGVIAISDKVKDSSKAAIAALQKRDIEVYMLTGDQQAAAQAVASDVGIRHFQPGVLPQDKSEFVKKLQEQGKVVAMVGDGINDSQALAQADVSIAMGKGSDIAMDVAKITLITSDLQSIPRALNLSARTVAGIRQNLFWAFIYNAIGIPLAAGVLYPVNGFLLDPMIAGGAMALSSISVVANSLRLRIAKI